MTKSNQEPSFDFSEFVDASHLQDLVGLLARISGSNQLSPKILQMEFVVDADAIIQTIIRKCQNPNFVSTFEELKASGVVVFHLPHWGVTEIENSALEQVAEKRGLQLDTLRQEWRRISQCFTIHEGYSYPHIHSWDAARKDWKDEPYASLQQDITAKAVLTSNIDDLVGLGADVLSPNVLREVLEYARAETACVTIKVGGVSLCAISAHGVESAVKSAPALWAKTPGGLKWGALGLVAAALIYPPTRKKALTYAKMGGAKALEFSSFLADIYIENYRTAENFKKTHN